MTVQTFKKGHVSERAGSNTRENQEVCISVRHADTGYGRGKNREEILHDVSFDVPEGRRMCLMGANGCGKTTMLRTLLGILPCSGDITIHGSNIRDMKRKDIAREAALMTQIPSTYFAYSIRETVMQGRFLYGKGLFGLPSKRDREKVEECLEATGLADIADHPITALSGGQRQRVFLARTLAQDSPILFLDEPTNHLDMKYQADLVDYLLRWSQGSSMGIDGKMHKHTLVAVFHDVSLALNLAEEAVLLKKGSLLAKGNAANVLTKENLETAYGMDVASYMNGQYERWQQVV